MIKRLWFPLAAAAALPGLAAAAPVDFFFSDADPVGGLNAEFDADGKLPQLRARFTVDKTAANEDFTQGSVSVKYRVLGTGFADLTEIPGAFHLVHLHSQFPENVGLPIPEQLNGPFFTGDPGDPIPSVPPEAGVAADRLGDPGYLNFLEEVPELGPVSFYLGKTDIEVPEDGVSPLVNLLMRIESGEIDPKTYLPDTSEFDYEFTRMFDLEDQDERRLILNVIGPDGNEFGERVMDAHGFAVPDAISDSVDTTVFGVPDPDLSQPMVNGFSTLIAGVPLGDGTEFRVTAPAVGDGTVDPTATLAPIPVPAALPLMAVALAGLGALGLRRRG